MSKFKKGDKVFCTTRGFGVVTREITHIFHAIYIEFEGDFLEGVCSQEGFSGTSDAHPSLFHSPQEAAEYFSKIKRREKRVVRLWVNIYPEGYSSHATREIADKYAPSPRVACVEIEQEVEYEV